MCKIAAIIGVDPKDRRKQRTLRKLAAACVAPMTKWDDHAFGYAAVSAKHGLYGERWLNVNHALKIRREYATGYDRLQRAFGLALDYNPEYNAFGAPYNKTRDTLGIIMHSRISTTGDRSIASAHPFVRDNTALIHNGIIEKGPGLRNITSTCDSEMILNAYKDQGVDKDPHKMQSLADLLDGYYACAILNKTKGGWVFDVFRDTGASLNAAYIPQLDALMVATTEEIIKTATETAGLSAVGIGEVDSGTFLRIDLATGNRTALVPFEPLEAWDYYKANYHHTNTHGYARPKGAPSPSKDQATEEEKSILRLADLRAEQERREIMEDLDADDYDWDDLERNELLGGDPSSEEFDDVNDAIVADLVKEKKGKR